MFSLLLAVGLIGLMLRILGDPWVGFGQYNVFKLVEFEADLG